MFHYRYIYKTVFGTKWQDLDAEDDEAADRIFWDGKIRDLNEIVMVSKSTLPVEEDGRRGAGLQGGRPVRVTTAAPDGANTPTTEGEQMDKEEKAEAIAEMADSLADFVIRTARDEDAPREAVRALSEAAKVALDLLNYC